MTTKTTSMPGRQVGAIATVYGAGFVQGLTLVSFPASSTVLMHMHGFTDAQYGSIFLPQVALAVIGAIGGGMLARRLGLKVLLVGALMANALSQAALAGSTAVTGDMAYTLILFGTAALGLGFGMSGAPLNSYPPIFFPRQKNASVVALHSALGVGLMAGPLTAGAFIAQANWIGFPLLLLGLALLLAFASAVVHLPSPTTTEKSATTQVDVHPVATPGFWLFALAAVLYAFAEGTFSNWAVVYLQHSKHLPEALATLALSLFWGAMVGGRLLISVLVLRVPAEIIWRVLPLLMIAAFLLLPYAATPALALAFFALAGLACSAFFPLTIALISKRFPDHVAWVASMMFAALMIGVGLGSYVIGSLRTMLSFEALYRVSALYPLFVFALVWLAVPAANKRRGVLTASE